MRVIKKIFKVLGIILLVLLGIIILGLLTTTIIHRVNLKRNKDFLAEQGLYQPVSVGDHSLNLVNYGGAEDGHRIIGFSGSGYGSPLQFRQLASELKQENQVYYLARAGYDGSDDVKDDMTVSFVVEDYRKALQNAGVEAPYVLMPHSYSGTLITYWVSKYPEEVEAVIDLDTTIMPDINDLTDEQLAELEDETGGMGTIRTLINLGIGDVAGNMFFPADESYSADDQRADRALALMTFGSRAFYAEMSLVLDNWREIDSVFHPTDVPKLYISAENGYETLEEFKAADRLSEQRINKLTEDFSGTGEERREKAYELEWAEMQEYKTETMQPYFDRLGNVTVANLPGGHWVHEDQPAACAEVITDFLHDLD